MRMLSVVSMLTALLLAGCGASTNFNQLWPDDEGGDSLYTKARIVYDQGNFEEALESAEKAVELNPDNERAAVLLGYIYLSTGGIDPYRLARELISLSSDGDSSGANLQDDGAGESADDAASTLVELSGLINLSEADFDVLGTAYGEDSGSNGSGLFDSENGGVEIIVPATVNDELRNQVEVLDYMNKAVMAVCRFVDNGTKSDVDDRHGRGDCEQVDNSRTQGAKAHFLWAFTHLTEALVYQSVLLYSGASSSGSTSNFQVASGNLDEFEGDFTGFATAVSDMKGAVDTVFATDVPDGEEGITMINATLSNLETVEAAFGALTGLPSNISSRLTESLDKIRAVGDTVGTDETGDAEALKGEMTEKFAGVVSEKVDTAIADKYEELGIPEDTTVEDLEGVDGVDQEAIDEFNNVCDSYDGLVEGIPDEDKNIPAACE